MEKIIAKKSLGQNFLKSSTILDKIISTADVQENDIVLEVGPGKGALTEKLLEKAKKVVAVEKDDRLIYFLKEKFAEEIKKGKFTLIRGDILNFDPNSTTDGLKTELCGGETPTDFDGYKVVANIPYYITGKLIRNFLSSDFQPSQMVLMVQKEVANRIVGEKDTKKPKENILSLSVKVYGIPKYIKTIPAKYFSPQPKVDSAILLIDKISKDFFKNIDEEKFFDLIHQAFSSKRKVLVNNLSKILPKEDLVSILEKLNISPKTRAEDLSVDNWKDLYQELKI
ncbi:ribosomal RNA small subunit methyltransferase A [Patescibacteria group bacterium]|nr:ribosomal RNA small subunit methyltransferase A [Patescibacteria group bacterium]